MQDKTKFIIGTIRAIKDETNEYVVLCKDGTDLVVSCNKKLKIGSDIIGEIRNNNNVLEIEDNIADCIFEQEKSNIIPAGIKNDLAVRILEKLMLKRSSIFSPGKGISIERTTTTSDLELKWAIDNFKVISEKLGIALNIIDVKSASRSSWNSDSFIKKNLPADAGGSTKANIQLSEVLNSGFHPICSRFIENITRKNTVSINFIIPYSPFAGSTGFATDISKMNRQYFPITKLSLQEIKKISSARQIALSFAHVSITDGIGHANIDQSKRTLHLATCFADAVASLLFLKTGGRKEAIEIFADLKESSLHFGQLPNGMKDKTLEEATHKSIRECLNPKILEKCDTMENLVSEAIKIARKTSYPANKFLSNKTLTKTELENAKNIAEKISINFETASLQDKKIAEYIYRNDLEELIKEHGDNNLSAKRLLFFTPVWAPNDFLEIFDKLTMSINDRLNNKENNNLKQNILSKIKLLKDSNSVKNEDIPFADDFSF